MSDHLPGSHERTTHWQHIYETNETDAVSWYQSEPVVSLELIDLLGMAPEAAPSTSAEVHRLLARGFTDLAVLGISLAALQASRQRVGDDVPVTWLAEDLLTWARNGVLRELGEWAVRHLVATQSDE